MIQETNLSPEQLKIHFGGVKRQLWTGKMKEEEFWTSLQEAYPELSIKRARDILFDSIVPLPAAQYLERWSEGADIHLLSNHCKEWIQPNLDRLSQHAKSVTISNQVGLCKPEIEIYQLVETQLALGAEVLFIDDQEKICIPLINSVGERYWQMKREMERRSRIVHSIYNLELHIRP